MKKRTLPSCCLLAVLLSACSKAEGDAEAAVKKTLTDPSSAQFQKMLEKDEYVCGEVNSKNKMGGYVGFRRFYVDRRGKGVAVIDPREWASPDTVRIFGKEILTPSNDTATFEAKYNRVCP